MSDKEQAKEKAVKELEEFKKDFHELMSKYPMVMVSSDIRGDLMAYHKETFVPKISID